MWDVYFHLETLWNETNSLRRFNNLTQKNDTWKPTTRSVWEADESSSTHNPLDNTISRRPPDTVNSVKAGEEDSVPGTSTVATYELRLS